MSGDLYPNIAQAIKAAEPDVHLHAFSPEEVLYGTSQAKQPLQEFLLQLRDSGVDSLPGTSAEILDDEIRV
jgi:FO synthase subunit 2